MNYYLDESGNTGDLINKKNDMGFANQPIFTHSCIGIDDKDQVELVYFINQLKKHYEIDESLELKSQDYYIKKPEIIYNIVRYIVEKDFPLVCEVMDKKYNVAISMVNHLIFPAMRDESSGEAQYIRNILSDFITRKAPDNCYTLFSELCKSPSEEKLIITMNSLKEFFEKEKDNFADSGYTILMINETLDDYYIDKKTKEDAIKKYIPEPDYDSNGNKITLLPNTFSFYNLIARLNKIHNRKLSLINLYHDTSDEFSATLKYCMKNIKGMNTENIHKIPGCDFEVIESFNLAFIDSKDSIGVQIADIIAGFLNRYIYGLMYKEIKMDDIYHATFDTLMEHNRKHISIGTNIVLPISKRNWLFTQFGL